MALAGKSQRSLAIQMVPALHKGGGVVVTGAAHRGERLIGIHVHTAQRINNVDKPCKIDADIVLHVHTVQVAEGVHAGLHTVKPGVGQLILAVCSGKVHIIIARGVDQHHLLGNGVHCGNDIHITARFFGQIAAGVHAAQVQHKRLFGDLIGLGVAQKTVGHIAQRVEALLCPHAAHRHGGAQHHREHPGHCAWNIVLLTALDQQPQQHQQRRQHHQIQHRQHLGAPQLHQRQNA